MKKISIFNRIILLLTGHLAGYEILKGVEGMGFWPVLYYTIAFGETVLTCLLLMLFGFEILKNTAVVVFAAIIPLSMSLAIITQYIPWYHYPYLAFAIIGLLGIQISRMIGRSNIPTIILAVTHGIAGLHIIFLPIALSYRGVAHTQFLFVGLGGAVVALAGILLAVIKTGVMKIPEEKILALFPILLLLANGLFVWGLTDN